MNAPDPFEERLRHIPFREAPVSLRENLLRAAQTSATSAGRDANPIRVWLEHWSWGRRTAWGALGFVWVIILLLNVAALALGGSSSPQRAERQISPALTAALREQRALRDRLLQEASPPALPPMPRPDAGLKQDRRVGRWIV